MGSPAYWGKLANFEASLRKPALVAFGLFNAQDNLGFIADIPGLGASLATTSISFASPLAFDTSTADVISVTLTGNVTSSSINYGGGTGSSIPSGKRNWLRIVQDATGGRTLVLPTNLLYDEGYAIDPGPQRATVLPIEWDAALSKWKFFTDPFSVPIA